MHGGFHKGGVATGHSIKSHGKQQTLSHRNPSFHATNSTARVLNHPALISSQAGRDAGSALSNTLGQSHLH